jgi:hypothetical protein
MHQRPRATNYFFAQAGGQWLATLGFRRTLFNHFAGVHDTNLYFTFPERGEDLLALGTIADGVFGDYHYRHPTYADYCRGVSEHAPGLQGGLRHNALENRLQPLTTRLLAGHIPAAHLEQDVPPALLDRWRAAALLTPASPSGDCALTGNGSWFVGNMISQLIDASV